MCLNLLRQYRQEPSITKHCLWVAACSLAFWVVGYTVYGSAKVIATLNPTTPPISRSGNAFVSSMTPSLNSSSGTTRYEQTWTTKKYGSVASNAVNGKP